MNIKNNPSTIETYAVDHALEGDLVIKEEMPKACVDPFYNRLKNMPDPPRFAKRGAVYKVTVHQPHKKDIFKYIRATSYNAAKNYFMSRFPHLGYTKMVRYI